MKACKEKRIRLSEDEVFSIINKKVRTLIRPIPLDLLLTNDEEKAKVMELCPFKVGDIHMYTKAWHKKYSKIKPALLHIPEIKSKYKWERQAEEFRKILCIRMSIYKVELVFNKDKKFEWAISFRLAIRQKPIELEELKK